MKLLCLFLLFAWISLGHSELDPRGLLDDFDLSCLQTFMNDPAAQNALRDLQNLNLQNTQANQTALLNFAALEISEHLSCIEVESSQCGTVKTFPPREDLAATVNIIIGEINSKTDDEILETVNFDINELCASLSALQAAIVPHNDCISRNLNAFLALPGYARDAVLALLRGQSDTPIGNPWDLNFTSILDLTAGCDDFKSQVASSIRTQLTSSIWTDTISWLLSNYDVEAFDTLVTQSLAIPSEVYGCALPTALVCTKQRASFSSTCDLIQANEFDFTLQGPSGNNEEEGSPYYNAFLSFSETESGTYPCQDAFADACFGGYLSSPPPIPDLSLDQDCKTAAYYHELSSTPTTAPTSGPTSPPTSGPTSPTSPTTPPTSGPTSRPTPDNDSEGNGSLPNPSPSSLDSTKTPLDAGAVVAIVFAVLIAVAVVVGGAAFAYKKKMKAQEQYQVQLE